MILQGHRISSIFSKMLFGLLIFFMSDITQAGTPLWTFTPTAGSNPTQTVLENMTATVEYIVRNQSQKSKKLVIRPMRGVSQTGPCILSPKGQAGDSCLLTLNIRGSAIPNSGIHGGPLLCLANPDGSPNSNQCYQPSSAYILNITKKASSTHTVGGEVFGLVGTVVLVNNSGDPLSLSADGPFTFSTPLESGNSYSVTVQSQPATQTCTVANGSGVISDANVTSIIVNCSTNTRTIGGTVSGLGSGESVVLQNNGSDNLIINADGSFTFPTPVAQGSTYNVTVLTQPSSQICTVSSGSGVVGATNITNVQVTCNTNAYSLGGMLSGLALTETVVLENDGETLTLTSNGPFTFPTPIAQNAPYNVTVQTQPATQTCLVSNGSGTMGGAPVTNVGVTCTTNSTTLNASVSDLALSVTGLTEYGVTGTPSSGLPRIITITNTGSATALNLAVSFPTWPAGTSSSTTCTSTLAPSTSCTITVTPGNTATSDGTNPCSVNGTAPVPGVIQVTADNASTVSTNVVVLNYVCVYQGGYVYALDDTTANTASVGGKVATTSDQSAGVVWGADSGGGASFDEIYGISEISTTSVPDPGTGQVAGQTACNGATDGACNTNNIYVFYQTTPTGAPINPSFYAAGNCKQTISTYSDWYLPATCELAYGGLAACGTAGTPTLQNMRSALMDNGRNLIVGRYWTSTERFTNPSALSWEYFSAVSSLINSLKFNVLSVRCSRALSP